MKPTPSASERARPTFAQTFTSENLAEVYFWTWATGSKAMAASARSFAIERYRTVLDLAPEETG